MRLSRVSGHFLRRADPAAMCWVWKPESEGLPGQLALLSGGATVPPGRQTGKVGTLRKQGEPPCRPRPQAAALRG